MHSCGINYTISFVNCQSIQPENHPSGVHVVKVIDLMLEYLMLRST
jgi:hypothetical protein